MGEVDVIEWACVLHGHHIQNDWVEQWICIKFCIKLEHSSTETIQMIKKAATMGNWSLVASLLQCTCSCITSCADFFAETSDHPGNSALLQSRFVALWLLAFPKTKTTFEREEISDCQWNSGKYNGAADSYWENCERSQGAYFEGDWGVIVLCTMFLVSYTSSINVFTFHITWLDTFWTDLIYQVCDTNWEFNKWWLLVFWTSVWLSR